jgi:hypothetical protein
VLAAAAASVVETAAELAAAVESAAADVAAAVVVASVADALATDVVAAVVCSAADDEVEVVVPELEPELLELEPLELELLELEPLEPELGVTLSEHVRETSMSASPALSVTGVIVIVQVSVTKPFALRHTRRQKKNQHRACAEGVVTHVCWVSVVSKVTRPPTVVLWPVLEARLIWFALSTLTCAGDV